MILEREALLIGLLAGAIAIGAFLGRARAALARRDESEAQFDTAIGGLIGLAVGLALTFFGLAAE